MKRLVALAAMVFCLGAHVAPAQDFGSGAAEPVKVSAAVKDNRLEVTYVIPAGQHMTLQKDLVTIEPKAVPGLEFGGTVYPVVAEKDEEGAMVYRGSVTVFREFKVAAPVKAGTKLALTAGWQVCLDTGTCFSPETAELTVALPELTPAAKDSQVGIGIPACTKDAKGSADKNVRATLPATPGSLWYFLALAFLGGMILNLMPCVLPVLSIKMLGIVKSAHDDPKSIRDGALAYTAGVLVSFAALAGVVMALKAGGSAVGWGFQFQNPVFVMALLVVVWVFALSLFDLFMIRAPGMQAASAASAKRGLAGSFFSGVFAVLLATPCTAPMLGAALGFAFSQTGPVILLAFLLVGLGLAFPFLVAGFFPRTTRFVPKPGEWMNTFREVMGFLLLGTAVWLGGVLRLQVGDKIQGVLWYLLVLSFACWLYGRFANIAQPLRRQWLFTVVAAAVAVGGWLWLVDLKAEETQNVEGRTQNSEIDKASGWETFTPERVAELRKAGTPVFIDFGAEWCMTCKANEHGVLYTDEIREAFRRHGVVPLRGDYTRKNPVIAEWMKKVGRSGVPVYLYYAPGAAEPVLLPELITKGMVLDLLK